MTRRLVLPPGVELDREGGTIVLNGVRVLVGNAMLSPPDIRTERVRWNPGGTTLEEKFVRTPLPPEEWRPLPLSVHLTLLAGENGWWVELSLWPEQEFYGAASMTAGLPDQSGHPNDDVSVEEVLRLLRIAQAKTEPPPSGEWEPGPFSGQAPGTWYGFEWLDEEEG